MKKITFLILMLVNWSFAQQQTVTYSINPTSFNEGDSVTLTFNGNSINEATWGLAGNALYLWSWSYDLNDSNQQDCPTNGSWGNSDEANRLTYNAGPDTYTITFTPTAFYSRTGIGRIGFLIKAKDGNGDKKSQDILVEVGAFQATLTNPTENSATILTSGSSLNITATNTNGNASYNLKANGISINNNAATSSYSYNHTNITSNQNYELEITQSSTTIIKKFSAIINPNIPDEALPVGVIEGINYNSGDPSKAILVLDAPLKDFVYVAGSFNNWQPNTSYAMKKDPSSTKFWIELTGLTSGQIETYQYWVVDETPIANSPALVKTADPYSTLVLSPFDDPSIPASTYPNLPTYPTGQEREVTVLQTNQAAYNWQVPNFNKPKKEDLVIYEVLIRDFDADRNFQDIIDKISYFKNLNINAIQLMPVMEFEGNESWGYNTAFHMALDKFYGTEDKFKELVDTCHQNGIAVILDVALNHAFGRNSMVRLWMNDADNDGWGEPSSENPYFNETAQHSYNVGSDFDHSNSFTKVYTKRVVKHWIEEFNIDGFRWDLTKGFTQNCSANDEGCTNSYQQDRVDILKDYADYSWSLDETHYVIFEHLGTDNEEKEWANYRLNDATPKGIMLWGKMTGPYSQLTMGYATDSDFSRMGHKTHTGFNGKRVVGYAESHDEVRVMEKNQRFGNSNGGYDTQELNTALSRIPALGAVTLTIPGPKMIWHFGELGMENSIFTCSNGSLNLPDDAPPSGDGGTPSGDCKLDTKPQPQWTNNWLNDADRSPIYTAWSRINDLKINEPVFEGDYNITSGNLTPRISIFTGAENTSGSELKNVIIVANFGLSATNVNPNFPYTGNWYDLMDESSSPSSINGSTTSITLAPGEFKVYGNQASTLSVSSIDFKLNFKLSPNPTNSSFSINENVSKIEIYNLTGKLVKSFNGDFRKGDSFNISDLPQSLYLVKVANNLGEENTVKLVKL